MFFERNDNPERLRANGAATATCVIVEPGIILSTERR
jgi:hypothetical protein